MAADIDHIVIAVPNLDDAAGVYQRLGFTLTARAQHPWGTANRLVQFAGQNYIELLALEKPALVPEHDFTAHPAEFSFGAYNRDFLEAAGGMSMLALKGAEPPGDADRFLARGLNPSAPFDFERKTVLPDGGQARLAFTLTYAVNEDMPLASIFTCFHRFPENFWRPAFQAHENGAARIAEVIMAARRPEKFLRFFAALSGVEPSLVAGGLAVDLGSNRLLVLTPETIARRFCDHVPNVQAGPRFAAIVIEGANIDEYVSAPADACGVGIEWRRSA